MGAIKKERTRKTRLLFLLAFNLCIVGAVVELFLFYMRSYSQMLYEQNLSEIRSTNNAAAQIAAELSRGQERKLAGILNYFSHNSLTWEEALLYLDESGADESVVLQLISSDYTGRAILPGAGGAYPQVDYTSWDYMDVHNMVDARTVSAPGDEMLFSAEFTDSATGLRSFARYAYITLTGADGTPEVNTLMAVYRSSDFISRINQESGFAGMSTVLINANGSYVLRSAAFKSDSFFQYLYTFNGLTLDEKNEVESHVLASDGGTLRYRNSAGQECVYVYTNVPETNWFCVSCVPIASFHSASPDLRFAELLIVLLTVMLIVDILYLVELNRSLKASAIAANAASEAKTDFLSRMSHDIRTPINVITGMTELAMTETDLGRIDEYLENIRASGRFLLGLVNDILDMNKVESGKMELHLQAYSHEEFVTYIRAVIVPLCKEKDIHFTMTGDMEGLILKADPLRLNQVFFNLLSNAVKFTPRGGHIALEGSVTPLSEHHIALDFVVRDDGAGMTAEFQKHMFSAFAQEARTESQNKNGTGLGLAIVEKLVGLMGGTIRCESEVNHGTAFFVRLEFDTLDKQNEPLPGAATQAELTGRRILLCEDHPLNARIIVQLLTRRGVQVDVAENGKIGVETFAAAPAGTYDAVLMDIRMPVMNGLDATAALRALAPQRPDAAMLPIIALTANAYDSDISACMAVGMNAHLAKPIEPQKLYDALAQQIGAARPVPKKDET